MENASKALIIAGSILLAIVLISLGMMILGQGESVINSDTMTVTEIETFNKQFTQYEKNKIRGAEIKSLITKVIASNASKENQDKGALIEVKIGSKDIIQKKADGTMKTDSGATAEAKTNILYDVSIDYSEGRVSKITIKQSNATP